jgi:hypothetical protein
MRAGLAAAMLLCSVSPGIAMAQQSSRQHAHRHRQQVEKSGKLHPKVTAVLVWPPEQLLPPPLIVVTYQEGALSVTAEDATLREVFERLNESTGAAVEAPAMEERVSVHLGPQSPVQVVEALLEGTHLNYAVLGGTGPSDPLRRIIVMPKPAGGAPTLGANSQEVAARARARAEMHRAEKGGDEGVWDDKEAQPAQAPPAPSPRRDRVHK